MSAAVHELLKELPKVDEVLRRPELVTLAAPRWAVLEAVRCVIDRRRQEILAGGVNAGVGSEDVARIAAVLARPSLRPVINATGVVLHTNLGRAPLPAAAVAHIAEVARGYSNLEYSIDDRERGSRHDHLRAALTDLCGAEAAVVVNNNAAAVLLSLAALAAGKEVIVSRGELVEIGGSFRIPDVMRASGARLVEVGTTNKTHPKDYASAIGPDTGLLLKVHRSNFAVIGFTAEVDAKELVAIGRARGVPTMIDLGSGSLLDLAVYGLPAEPTVGQTVASGADVVTFSGDKLLGGPQAGVIVGAQDAVARIKAHPLMRAVRPDKLTIAALEATLAIYRGGNPRADIPAVRMLAATADELRARAERLAAMVTGAADKLSIVQVKSAVGGGALPTAEPASWALALTGNAVELDTALRAGDPPIVGRIAGDRLLLDVRTIADDELPLVAARI